MAWEVRVSVAPDFRLHYYIGLGSLYFVSWDKLNGYAQTHPKSPSHKPISTTQTGYHRLKFFAELSFKKATVSPSLTIRTPNIFSTKRVIPCNVSKNN